MRISSQVSWSNRSVLRLAGSGDPIKAIESKARQLALEALDRGWSGPPYDPLKLADILGIKLIPRDDLHDARTVATPDGKPIIEFNPNRPRIRVRFSIAHEIIHTKFPDFHHRPRYRGKPEESDEWQLEMLCNLGAAELLMPAGRFGNLTPSQATIDWALEKRKELEVSTEALLLRLVRLAEFPCAAFSVSPVGAGGHRPSGRLDYLVASRPWEIAVRKSQVFQLTPTLAECAAIGYTAKGDECWPLLKNESLHVECVGLPGYEGQVLPRVAGLIFPTNVRESRVLPTIEYLRGDALNPRGEPPRIIAHVLNNKTANWGGRGIATSIKKRWPEAQNDFRDWMLGDRTRLSLGNSRPFELEAGTYLFSMIAQCGYGPSESPRFRYGALRSCLEDLAVLAAEKGASVHMPRIGTGQARGSWEIIEELITDILIGRGCRVTVYDLPM